MFKHLKDKITNVSACSRSHFDASKARSRRARGNYLSCNADAPLKASLGTLQFLKIVNISEATSGARLKVFFAKIDVETAESHLVVGEPRDGMQT